MSTNLDMVWVISSALTCMACSGGPGHHCVQDRESRNWLAASVSCEAEFESTHDLARAIDAATAYYNSDHPRDTLRLAAQALIGPTIADARSLIGSAQLDLGELESAVSQLRIAAVLHAIAGNASAETRDHYQLSGALYQLGDYREALDAATIARDVARRAHDERMAVFLELANADIRRQIGDRQGAERAIEQVLTEALEPGDRVVALLKRGILHLDQGHTALAREPLTRALAAERVAASPRGQILEALHLNMSYVERKAGEFFRAFEEIARARLAGADTLSFRLNRALIYADMGKLADAADDLDVAEAEKLEGEWSWWVPFQRAQVAARLDDVPTAIAADHRAIEQVAKLASKSGAFGPTVIANHREPHLHLVGLLATQQRWADVLDMVATMDGQSLLDSGELASELIPSAPSGPPGRPPPVTQASSFGAAKSAVEAWRGQRLVIVVPGGDRVWRLDVHDGQVAGSDIGDASALAALARKLETDPGNLEAGRELGTAMLVPQLAPHARVALLVIGPMARAPLAGLQVGDRPAIARYQLMRAPGLLPRAHAQRSSHAAIVIGDPQGNLRAAAEEARQVARRLEGSALVGPAATRAAFVKSTGADVLHIAAHTTRGRDGAVLDLTDGPVTVADIAKLAPAPRLVVLASCGAATGRDDAGNGSLANAFLDAGADVVVATRWSVGDAEAAGFVEAFYAAGGDRDPVRALGAAQLASKLPATAWAAFEVFVARPAP